MYFFVIVIGIPAMVWFIWRFGFKGEYLPERKPDLVIWDERENSDR